MFDLSQIQSWLDHSRNAHNVVGASLAVYADGREYLAASGLLNIETGLDVTTDSAFQIGSITKVFTATLLMQLVDEGSLDIEQPVQHYLPDFQLADREAAARITVKQLMNHTSGIDGEFPVAHDPDDSSIASYVAKLAQAPMLSPPGYIMAYCNAGWVVLGRIIEVLRQNRYPEIVMEHICRPLGMAQAFCRPQDSLRYRCAVGHERGLLQNEEARLAHACYLPLHSAPTGSVLSMSAPDLLAFAKAHLAIQTRDDGKPLLNAESRLAMQTPTVELPPLQRVGFTHMGLGWSIGQHDAYTVLAHDGGTFGQFAYLRVYPQQNLAFALLTNSLSVSLFTELDRELSRELLDIEPETFPPQQSFTMVNGRYAGTYSNGSMRLKVEQQGESLTVQALDQQNQPLLPPIDAKPYLEDCFQLAVAVPILGDKFIFHDTDTQGRAPYLRIASRMLKRI